jgi:predicted ATPase/class 3 adenylate cyclase/Tfp pilus assembly protein PilF
MALLYGGAATTALTTDEEKRDDGANNPPTIAPQGGGSTPAGNTGAMIRPDRAVTPLAIRLFGPFEVHLHGEPLPRLRSRKGHWLLALLTLRRGAPLERSWLAGTLWPDSSERQALVSLRSSLVDLRRALGPEAGRLHSPTPQTLSLDLSGAEVDVLAFDAAIAQGEAPALERALALYRGPLLEGCLEEWSLPERQTRTQAYLQALETLAMGAMSGGDPSAAEPYLRLAVAVDPLRESAQRALMQALAAGGNTAAATQLYRELRERLHRELNAEPDSETMALFQQLRAAARRPGLRPELAAPHSPLTARAGHALAASDEPQAVIGPAASADQRASSGPSGTVTFLLTDIEGSTRLWLQHPDAMRHALARHDTLLTACIEGHGGKLLKQRGEGDSGFAVFARATDAVAAALELQRALAREAWPTETPLQVRVALHTGEAELQEGDYYGPAVNQCARLRAVGHGGQTLLSQTTAALAREELPAGVSLRDLGAHRLKDLQRAEPIFQLVHPELPAEFPPLRSLEAFAHNLPVQLTRFIGRERESAEVKRLLSTAYLLTLTGAGGCGKTRLALQVAADLTGEHGNGVWLVELASLSDPALVAQTVASTLGVREELGRLLIETLADSLRPRSLLLVLDNCEHLLSACAQLADRLLRACPNLRILATSREALGLLGEQTYRVPSLSLPDPSQLPSLERLQEYEAVQLFADRAALTQPAFAVTPANARALVQVCQRLDGIPLAIELAAARVKALPVEKIAERLDDMFRLLTGGSRTALPRQQTLRAAIDWSYHLLSEPEQRLLRRLSVFAGGWTLEVAEAVCAGAGIEEEDVLDLLTALVEKSLVQYEAPATGDSGCGEARYRLLETVRQYSRDRLLQAGEAEVVRGGHLEFFLGLAERAEPELYGAYQGEWLERLELEHDNLRAALEWGWGSEPASALRLAGALGGFWDVRGHWSEGREALEREVEAPGEVRAKALQRAGWLAQRQGVHERAKGLSEASLALSRELGDKRGIAASLNTLGFVAWRRGDYPAVRALLEESLAVWRELGDPSRIAGSLSNLGVVTMDQGDYGTARALLGEALVLNRVIGNRYQEALNLDVLGWVAQHQGDYEAARASFGESLVIDRQIGAKGSLANSLVGLGCVAWEEGDAAAARRYLEESLAIWRELGDKGGIAWSHDFLGRVTRGHGDWEAARALHEKSLAIWQEIGDKTGIGRALQGLGDVASAQGEYGRARALFQESLTLRRELGDRRGIAEGLERVAHVAGAEGDAERAARLFGAAEALREALGAPLPPVERAHYDRSIAAVRAALGEKAFAAAWTAGRAMPLEAAVARATEEESDSRSSG